ncbi:hypothetical protein [uncultured Clostridium sp.]|uniref:hypothetical protein n=1 Tax=uncultured Clostridium sp. TaxID=59620 RepID=UPI0025D4E4AC|nr:hypothetical protein [uncultured Clostridium sp.]
MSNISEELTSLFFYIILNLWLITYIRQLTKDNLQKKKAKDTKEQHQKVHKNYSGTEDRKLHQAFTKDKKYKRHPLQMSSLRTKEATTKVNIYESTKDKLLKVQKTNFQNTKDKAQTKYR